MSRASVAQAAPVSAAIRSLRFDQTVPRGWVHRASISEVLLTDCVRVDDRTFHVGAQWPRTHPLYAPDTAGRHDVTLALETVRQSGILLATRHFGVPGDHHMALNDISVRIESADNFAVGPTPTDIAAEIATADERFARETLTAMRINVILTRGGTVIATSSGAFSCLSPGVYSRIRRHQPASVPRPRASQTPPIMLAASARVGRALRGDILVTRPVSPGDGEHVFAVHVPTNHPVLFDHALDHLPGMFQIEVMRQSAFYVAGRLGRPAPFATSWSARFLGYGGLDEQTRCVVRATPQSSGAFAVHARIEQGHRVISAGEFLLT